MRADQLLVERGLAASRAMATRLIAAGVRWRAPSPSGTWRAVTKNGQDLPDNAELELQDGAEARYVSRGGLKLEAALQLSGVAVQDRRCLDLGQSTGGFTDCLLQQGAAQVVGIDVGRDQLHPRLRADPRVLCLEQVNARGLNAQAWSDLMQDRAAQGQPTAQAGFEVLVGDLSFISQTLVMPAVSQLLMPGAEVLMLVKPQFELQPAQIGKGGLVKEAASYAVVEARLRQMAAELHWQVLGWWDSPILGGDGNREFLMHAKNAL
jgi:23S rRNA (cytidine1920-2'-O)/16S rRNA (cytidine1409-2'-O)-methyltransferase